MRTPTRADPPPARALDAAAVWATARSVWPIADADVARWLDSRGLRAESVDGLGLARWVARWPYGSGQDAVDRKLVVRVYDAEGRIVALRGRLVADAHGAPKEKGPAGVPTAGRLLACPLGAAMLRGEADAGRRVVICEGTPDWLSMATLWDADASASALRDAPAVLGIWSGSLTPAVLARIPDGAVVTLCPHADRSGEGYMRAAASVLLSRCRVVSAKNDLRENGGYRDFNDTLRRWGQAGLFKRLDAAEVVTWKA